jgi:hypothetical protein
MTKTERFIVVVAGIILALVAAILCGPANAGSIYFNSVATGCHVDSVTSVTSSAGGWLALGPNNPPPIVCPTPPPPTCTTAPVLASSTPGIENFSRMTGYVDMNYFGGGISPADITSFDSVYKKPWPGNGTLTAALQVPNNKYVSEKFTVPAGYMAGAPSTIYGNYTLNQTGYSAPVSLTISTCPGDFSDPSQPGSTVILGCWKNSQTAGGHVQWRKSLACQLQDNTTYYLNFINANIAGFMPGGRGVGGSTRNKYCSGSCSDSIRNGPGSWGSYNP